MVDWGRGWLVVKMLKYSTSLRCRRGRSRKSVEIHNYVCISGIRGEKKTKKKLRCKTAFNST